MKYFLELFVGEGRSVSPLLPSDPQARTTDAAQ